MNDKFKIIFVAIIFGCIIAPSVFCQSPTTEGTEFWLSFMANEKTPELSINVSAKRACTLTIKNINTGYIATATLNPGLNKLSPNLTPNTQCYVTSSEVVENKSLLITSTDTISLFANNYVSQLFDVTGVLPINALLDEYMIQTYPNSSKKQSYPPEFLIIATEDNTTVDITPTWNTGGSMIKDQTYSISLKKGQSYQVQAKTDLGSTFSGSLVKSRNGKKIAVFNGNRSEGIQDNSGNTSDGDHLFEQAVPVAFWGTKFVLSRSLNYIKFINLYYHIFRQKMFKLFSFNVGGEFAVYCP